MPRRKRAKKAKPQTKWKVKSNENNKYIHDLDQNSNLLDQYEPQYDDYDATGLDHYNPIHITPELKPDPREMVYENIDIAPEWAFDHEHVIGTDFQFGAIIERPQSRASKKQYNEAKSNKTNFYTHSYPKEENYRKFTSNPSSFRPLPNAPVMSFDGQLILNSSSFVRDNEIDIEQKEGVIDDQTTFSPYVNDESQPGAQESKCSDKETMIYNHTVQELSKIKLYKRNVCVVYGLPSGTVLQLNNRFGIFGNILEVQPCGGKRANKLDESFLCTRAQITFETEKSAANAIQSINNGDFDSNGRKFKATYKIISYCKSFLLPNQYCTNNNCQNAHRWLYAESVVTQQQIEAFREIPYGIQNSKMRTEEWIITNPKLQQVKTASVSQRFIHNFKLQDNIGYTIALHPNGKNENFAGFISIFCFPTSAKIREKVKKNENFKIVIRFKLQINDKPIQTNSSENGSMAFLRAMKLSEIQNFDSLKIQLSMDILSINIDHPLKQTSEQLHKSNIRKHLKNPKHLKIRKHLISMGFDVDDIEQAFMVHERVYGCNYLIENILEIITTFHKEAEYKNNGIVEIDQEPKSEENEQQSAEIKKLNRKQRRKLRRENNLIKRERKKKILATVIEDTPHGTMTITSLLKLQFCDKRICAIFSNQKFSKNKKNKKSRKKWFAKLKLENIKNVINTNGIVVLEFDDENSASNAISHFNNTIVKYNNKILRARHGTNKYCTKFLNPYDECSTNGCPKIHLWKTQNDVITNETLKATEMKLLKTVKNNDMVAMLKLESENANAWKWNFLEYYQSEEEKLVKKLTSILNKMTPEKFAKIAKLTIDIVHEYANTKEEMSIIIGLVLQFGIKQPVFGGQYAKLCNHLQDFLPKLKMRTFRKMVLQQTNKLFTEHRNHTPSKEEIQQWKDSAIDRDGIDLKRNKKKCNFFAIMVLVAELYNVDLIKRNLLFKGVFEEVLKEPSSVDLEGLCRAFKRCGKKMDKEAKIHVDKYLEKLMSHAKKFDFRTRVLVDQIKEMRENSWEFRVKKEVAKTKDEIKKDFEKEQAEKQSSHDRKCESLNGNESETDSNMQLVSEDDSKNVIENVIEHYVEFEELQIKYETQNHEMVSLKKQVGRLNQEIKNYYGMCLKLQQENEHWKTECKLNNNNKMKYEKQLQQIVDLHSLVENYKQQCNVLQTENNKLKNEYKTKCEKQIQEISNLNKQLLEYGKEIKNYESLCFGFQQQIQKDKQQRNILQNEINKLNENKENINEKISEKSLSNHIDLCEQRFESWLCDIVRLKQYLSIFKKHEYNDITMVEYIDEDVVINELEISKKVHVKLLLRRIEEFKDRRQEFNTLLNANQSLKQFEQCFMKNGILTVSHLKHIKTNEDVKRIFMINNTQEQKKILNMIHPQI